VSTIFAPKQVNEFQILQRNAIRAASGAFYCRVVTPPRPAALRGADCRVDRALFSSPSDQSILWPRVLGRTLLWQLWHIGRWHRGCLVIPQLRSQTLNKQSVRRAI